MPANNKPSENDPAFELALSILSGKWKAHILWKLHEENRALHYTEIKKAVAGISARMLSRHLKDLEVEAVISRHVVSQNPLRVEYSLADRGRALMPILASMSSWGKASPPRQD